MADELRGAIGGWEFKAYVLGTLFYRFISENLTDYINKLQEEAGVEGFNYADMADSDAEEARSQMVQVLVVFVFSLVLASCSKDEAYDTGERVIRIDANSTVLIMPLYVYGYYSHKDDYDK